MHCDQHTRGQLLLSYDNNCTVMIPRLVGRSLVWAFGLLLWLLQSCAVPASLLCPVLWTASPAPVPGGQLVAGDAEVQEHHELKPCLLEGPHQGPDPALLVVEVIQQTLLAGPQERPESSCCVKYHDTWPATVLMLQRKVHMLEQVLLLAVRAAAETQITTVSLACTLSRRSSQAE